ncbi:precorrin-6Y C5,15-methyltransferase subunit CbiT [Sphaerothrix gracilis]|uniref:precorrin-6Y C5,15-methyltransferase subunit CbiT n=1 Tax=Sphaerothrix gracilis TaxID=3151835 RepID=UPI0031FE13F5
MASLWPYITPGIPDALFEQLPGIPMSKREVRLLVLSYLRLKKDSRLWDIGAGTGTIAIEAALLCPTGQIVAVERDRDVANLIRHNCDRFQVSNVDVIAGSAPDCLAHLPPQPDCILIEGGRPLQATVKAAWRSLSAGGRFVVTVSNLENLYQVSESFAELQVRNIEVVQPAVNRLERRGYHQVFAAVDPIFIFSGEKLD